MAQRIAIPQSPEAAAKAAQELTGEANRFVAKGRTKFMEKHGPRAGTSTRAAAIFAHASLLEALLIYRDMGGLKLAEQMVKEQLEALKALEAARGQ